MDSERRAFLAELATLAAGVASAAPWTGCRRVDDHRGGAAPNDQPADGRPQTASVVPPGVPWTDAQRTALVAVLDRILPGRREDPGATEAGCIDFVIRELSDPRYGRLRRVVQRGLAHIETDAAKHGASSYAQLDAATRDAVLTAVHDLRTPAFVGEDFMRVLVVLTLEGFLSDPSHGGNRDGAGFRFAGFAPVRYTPVDGRGLVALPGQYPAKPAQSPGGPSEEGRR